MGTCERLRPKPPLKRVYGRLTIWLRKVLPVRSWEFLN